MSDVNFNGEWLNPKSPDSGTQGRPNSIDPNRSVMGPYADEIMAPPPPPPPWDQVAHEQLMRSAYNPHSYNYSSIPHLPSPREQVEAWWRAAQGQNGDNSAAMAAAAAAAAAAAVRQHYDQLRQHLSENRDQASGVLAGAMTDYNKNVNSNYDMYQSGAKGVSDSIAARGAEGQRTNQSQTDQFLRSMAALGVNGNVVAAQGQANADTLRNQNQLQSDLAARLAQVAASTHQNFLNSGALVNQGATGRLANNYNDMLNQINANETAALTGGTTSSGGGRGSSSSGSSRGPSAAELKMATQNALIANALGSGNSDAYLSALATVNPAYFSYISGLDTQNNDLGQMAYNALVSAAPDSVTTPMVANRFLSGLSG